VGLVRVTPVCLFISSFYPNYKLRDNILAPLPWNTESNLPQDDNVSVILASRSLDLPNKVKSWIPKFSGEKGSYGISHWIKFCEGFHFHQSGQEHPDIFLRLSVSSLTGSARKWINKTPEDLEQIFKKSWCEKENMDSLYSQYTDICKGSSEGIRDFNDRFNLLLKKV
jgi:hypothetical protein